MASDENDKITPPIESNLTEEQGFDYLKYQSVFAYEINSILKEINPAKWRKMYEDKTLQHFLLNIAAKHRTNLLDMVQDRLNSLGPEEFLRSIMEIRKACLIEILNSIENL